MKVWAHSNAWTPIGTFVGIKLTKILLTAVKLEFQGERIQHTSTISFLGVVFQENLSWSLQVDALRTDVSRAIGMLNKLKITPSV